MNQSSIKILFLFPYPPGTAASQRFRFEQYFVFLEELGIQYDCQGFLDAKTWQILYKPGHYFQKIWGILKGFGRRLWMLRKLKKYDFVFIHREASPIGPPVFEWLIAKYYRKKIIFDFDDAIWLPNTTASNFLVARLKFHSKTGLTCRWAYKVSAGNAYLMSYAQQFNPKVIINPTTIDTEHWHKPMRDQSQNEKLVIGWTGTHSTLKYLEEMVPILKELAQEYVFDFLVIANQAPDFDLPNLLYVPWNKQNEIADLLKMHIGVMPLSDDLWAKGKCGFKALQYMALGIPPLISPVGMNTEIVAHGINGFLCDQAEDWKKHLQELLMHTNLRIDLGKNARRSIIERYSVQSNRTNFLDLFQ